MIVARRSVLASAFLAAVAALSASAREPSSPQGLSSAESAVVARTNEARARRGLAPLAVDSGLVSGARRHASWMARNRSLTHGQGVAENIAMGQGSAAEAVGDWLRSDGHRANMLDGSHTRIGVGMARAADGTAYWCQQFR